MEYLMRRVLHDTPYKGFEHTQRNFVKVFRQITIT